MRTFAKVEILGNAGSDAEMRFTPGGKAVTNFPIAVNRQWQGEDGEKHKEREWFDVVTWGKLAEMVGESVKKGDLVLAVGMARMRSWQGPDGQNRFRMECQAREVTFLSFKESGRAEIEAEVEAEIDAGAVFA